ncbi:translation initiation factor IF-1A [Candidatus Pacearchaeota archaeon]|nr:translation initiation factor IF-1A [Candidatus Pacearchaeota archaeon]
MEDFGDFKEIKEENKVNETKETHVEEVVTRARMPRRGQLIGVVLQRLGGSRMSVKATDKKIRNCRVPGRFSRKFWLRPKDFVMIEPWPDNDDKADIVYQYRGGEINQIKKLGLTKDLEEEF